MGRAGVVGVCLKASASLSAMRLTTLRVLALSTLPPLTRLSGHKPSYEAKDSAVRKALLIWLPVPSSLISVPRTAEPSLGKALKSTS